MATVRICAWSGPRNVSTALMYAFAQRSDTRALDEPLYAHYLQTTGVDHPGRQEVIASMSRDGAHVIGHSILGPSDRPILFMKQMTHHLVDLNLSFLSKTRNVILIREPRDVLMSLARVLGDPTADDTGLRQQVELLHELQRIGQQPPVVDSRQLLLDPPGVLTELCARLGIPFDRAMLSWTAGPHPEDGVWSKHWYASVHRTTGFQPYVEKPSKLPPSLTETLARCQPYYETLRAHAIEAQNRA